MLHPRAARIDLKVDAGAYVGQGRDKWADFITK
jgi:hypothetical protein